MAPITTSTARPAVGDTSATGVAPNSPSSNTAAVNQSSQFSDVLHSESAATQNDQAKPGASGGDHLTNNSDHKATDKHAAGDTVVDPRALLAGFIIAQAPAAAATPASLLGSVGADLAVTGAGNVAGNAPAIATAIATTTMTSADAAGATAAGTVTTTAPAAAATTVDHAAGVPSGLAESINAAVTANVHVDGAVPNASNGTTKGKAGPDAPVIDPALLKVTMQGDSVKVPIAVSRSKMRAASTDKLVGVDLSQSPTHKDTASVTDFMPQGNASTQQGTPDRGGHDANAKGKGDQSKPVTIASTAQAATIAVVQPPTTHRVASRETIAFNAQVTLAPMTDGILVRHATLQGTNGVSTFNVVLQPEHLGQVHVQVQDMQGALQVTLSAQRPDTAQLLTQHAKDLVGMLSNPGGNSVSVTVVSPSSSASNNQTQSNSHGHQSSLGGGNLQSGQGSNGSNAQGFAYGQQDQAPEQAWTENVSSSVTQDSAATLRTAVQARPPMDAASRLDVQA